MAENRTPLEEAYEQLSLAQIAVTMSKNELEKLEAYAAKMDDLEKHLKSIETLNEFHKKKLNLIALIIDTFKDSESAIDWIVRTLEAISHDDFEEVSDQISRMIALDKVRIQKTEEVVINFLKSKFGDAVVIRPIGGKDEKTC